MKRAIIIFIGIVLLIIGIDIQQHVHFSSSVIPTPTATIHQDTGPIYDRGTSDTTVTSLTAQDIDAMHFSPLQEEILAGYDEQYQLSPLTSYIGDGFRFQYPSDMQINLKQQDEIILQKSASCNSYRSANDVCNGTITLYVKKFPQSISLSEWFITQDVSYFTDNRKIILPLIKQHIKITTVTGEKALYNDTIGQPGHFFNNVIFVHNNTGYDIGLLSYNVPGMVASFRKVVNSFQFTK